MMTRPTAAATLFAGLFLGVAAVAQTPLSLPAGVAQACLADAPLRDLDPDCIGAAAQQCQEGPGGDTTQGISECLMLEQAVWDQALNAEWRITRDSFADDPTASDSLLAAQRAWIAWRDAECRFDYDRYGGGSMRTIASAGCQMRMTARRALEIRAMREW